MLICIGLMSASAGLKAEVGADVWAWLDVTVWQEKDVRFHVFSHQAMSDGRGPIVQLVSPRFKCRAQPWLELGVGFSMLQIEHGGGDESFYDQTRGELEVNPIFKLGSKWIGHFRNRAEMRWDEWEDEPRPRMRHRLQLTRKIENLGPVSGFYFSNEWLVELDRGDWVENRVVPSGVTFALTQQASVDLFYMVRSFRFDDGWTTDHVAGVYLKLTL